MADQPQDITQRDSLSIHAELIGLEWKAQRQHTLNSMGRLRDIALNGSTEPSKVMEVVRDLAIHFDAYEDASADIINMIKEKTYIRAWNAGRAVGHLEAAKDLTPPEN